MPRRRLAHGKTKQKIIPRHPVMTVCACEAGTQQNKTSKCRCKPHKMRVMSGQGKFHTTLYHKKIQEAISPVVHGTHARLQKKQNPTIPWQLYCIILDTTRTQTHTYVTNANDSDTKCVRASSKHICHQHRHVNIISSIRSHRDIASTCSVLSYCVSTFDQTETATE